jgi:uncharacterized cupredoxin-like copper-binding protein
MSIRLPATAVLVLVNLAAGYRSTQTGSSAAAGAPGGRDTTRVGIAMTARDYTYDVPDTVAAGPATIRLANHGRELHQAQIVRLEDGKTASDLVQAIRNPGPIPSWVKFIGGPNAVAPGTEGSTTANLPAGHYAVLCFIPSPDGTPHVMKGMIRSFDVTGGASSTSGELPKADVTLKTVDYDFQPSASLTAGHHTILVENSAVQPHEVVLLKLAPGKSVMDFATWAEGGMQGPPPVTESSGVTAMDSGGSATFDADLTPGDYGLICFIPDVQDGKPHLAHGMAKQFKVE